MNMANTTNRTSIMLTAITLAVTFTYPVKAADIEEAAKAFNSGEYQAAIPQLDQLALRGNADAQYLLGHAYEHGKGVRASSTAAIKWYAKAATVYENKGIGIAAKHCNDAVSRLQAGTTH